MGGEARKAGGTSPEGSEMQAEGQASGGQTLRAMEAWKQEDSGVHAAVGRLLAWGEAPGSLPIKASLSHQDSPLALEGRER